MNILQRLSNAKELWVLSMPIEVPIPPDRSFLIWLNTSDDDQIQHAFIKTGSAMFRKQKARQIIGETDAARFCSSCLNRARLDSSEKDGQVSVVQDEPKKYGICKFDSQEGYE
jgi:hypothetical protein